MNWYLIVIFVILIIHRIEITIINKRLNELENKA